jgi:DNA-binding SARP family transcriptional activator
MLGGLRVRRGEYVVSHFETRKTSTVLARLALLPNRDHPREELVELLWPDEDPNATRPRLRQALAVLRRVLEPEGVPEGSVLIADRSNVRLNSEAATTDLREFQDALQVAARSVVPEDRVQSLSRAVALYRGDLLPGFYDDWIIPERERLADAHLNALSRLANSHAEVGDINAAIDAMRRAVAADVLREESHCNLMRFYAATGRTSDVMRQFGELERVLKEQLSTAPSLGTRRLFEELRGGMTQLPTKAQSPAPVSRPLAPAMQRQVAALQPPLPQARESAGPVVQPTSSVESSGVEPSGVEPVGGAVPLDSRFYIERSTDAEFKEAMSRQDSIVLVKGPREVGKTSLLARGLQQGRASGRHVVLTDFQKYTTQQLESTDVLFLNLAQSMADQLDLEISPDEVWNSKRSWNVNFERYLRREVLNKLDSPLVWGLDEVDRLFTYSYSSEVFGLFRSWHNERALDPTGPWSKLTLGIAYALEAHLFITDLNQSPFNVGTRLTLEDFNRAQVAELNHRYDSPLKKDVEIERFFKLIGGHPGLTRRGLYEMVTHKLDIVAFEAYAEHDEGAFRDHLHRIVILLEKSPELCDAIKAVLRHEGCADAEAFYRLRSAGIIIGESPHHARLRCRLYQIYLEKHLK